MFIIMTILGYVFLFMYFPFILLPFVFDHLLSSPCPFLLPIDSPIYSFFLDHVFLMLFILVVPGVLLIYFSAKLQIRNSTGNPN